MYARWGKRERWAAGAIVLLAAVGGGWHARTSTQAPTPAPLTAEEIAQAGPIEPWWNPTPDQLSYAEETGRPLAIRNTQGQRFVLIPPGEFSMGLPADVAQDAGQDLMHTVHLDYGFYIGFSEVTNREYRVFRPEHESGQYQGKSLDGDDQPVVQVSWLDAMQYCRWLTNVERQAGAIGEGEEYRLPTEAEWERACRAGTTTLWSFGDVEDDFDDYGWCHYWESTMLEDRGIDYYAYYSQDGRSSYDPGPPLRPGEAMLITQQVTRKRPNPWGLYDMHGNASEWTQTEWTQTEWTQTEWRPNPYDANDDPNDGRDLRPGTTWARVQQYARGRRFVAKGGSVRSGPEMTMCGCRVETPPSDSRAISLGFRLVRARSNDSIRTTPLPAGPGR